MLTAMKFDLVPKNKFPIQGVRLLDDGNFDPPVTICFLLGGNGPQ